ncbi:hypothetical protein ONZ45_g4499 [Pleurotus djamor]|nr:hypothetical protein ONZ45_g4499 [Pleurotus djamor]
MLRFVLLGSLCAASAVFSAKTNDWDLPCFHGECAYDLPESTGSGYIKISGSPGNIKDISPAAGWAILSCDPHSLVQDIHLVCEHESEVGSSCSHLFMHGDPVGALVRLPESCGSGPFARIASAGIADSQSLPTHVSQRLSRRQLTPQQIHVLSIDVDFDKIDTTKFGSISFSASGTTAPSVDQKSVHSRGLRKKPTTYSPFATGPGTYDFNASSCEVAVSKSRTLVAESKQCVPKSAGLAIEAGNTLNGTIHTGFEASGTLAPPVITNFSSFVSFSGNLSTRFNVSASLMGSATKDVDLWHELIHPVKIPGVLEMHPSFRSTAWVEAQFGLPASADLQLNFETDDARLWYPPRSEAPSITANLTYSHADLSVIYGTTGRTDMIGHVTPKIHLRVNAFGGKYKTETRFQLDMYSLLAVGAETKDGMYGFAAHKGGISINGTADGNIYGPPVNTTFFEEEWEIKKMNFPDESHVPLPADLYRPLAIDKSELHCPDAIDGSIITILS